MTSTLRRRIESEHRAASKAAADAFRDWREAVEAADEARRKAAELCHQYRAAYDRRERAERDLLELKEAENARSEKV